MPPKVERSSHASARKDTRVCCVTTLQQIPRCRHRIHNSPLQPVQWSLHPRHRQASLQSPRTRVSQTRASTTVCVCLWALGSGAFVTKVTMDSSAKSTWTNAVPVPVVTGAHAWMLSTTMCASVHPGFQVRGRRFNEGEVSNWTVLSSELCRVTLRRTDIVIKQYKLKTLFTLAKNEDENRQHIQG